MTTTTDLHEAAAALGRRGRSVNSEAQADASRANGAQPVKPGSRQRGRPRKETKMGKDKPLPMNLKNDVAYLEVAATSAPTARERAWARRQLKRIRKS